MRKIKTVINADSFDHRRFREIYSMSKQLQKIGKEGKELLPSFPHLQSDIWASFYKIDPQIREKVETELLTNKLLMQQMMANESYRKYRNSTKLDDLTSAIACLNMSQEIVSWLEEQVRENKQVKEAYQQMQEKSKENRQALNEAKEQFQKIMDKAIQQNIDGLGKQITFALDKVKETKENLKSLLSGLQPGSGEAELKRIPLRDQLKLAEVLQSNYKLLEIAKWAGRFKEIARKKQKTKYIDSIERAGVGLGDKVERLLPSELAMYSHPATRKDFLRRFMEGQIMMYETGRETLGKGPIVLCLDQSGSMRHVDSQAKGFTLALMSIARKQKRDFALILFDTSAMTFQYPKGKITVNDIIQLASTYLGGGTNFKESLSKAVEIISSNRFNKADLIFVTDGVDTLTNEFLSDFNKRKKEKQFNVMSVLLGKSIDTTVKYFSDDIVYASTFLEAGEKVFSV